MALRQTSFEGFVGPRKPRTQSSQKISVIRETLNNLLDNGAPEKQMALMSAMEKFLDEKRELLLHVRKRPGRKHPQNKLNDLDGNEWAYFTKTVLKTSYPAELGHDLRRRHYANKPPSLMKHLISFCTRPGQIILDPFAGVGGTLLGASMCGRAAVGIEINHEWISIYDELCRRENIQPQAMQHGDCLKVMAEMRDAGIFFDAIITDPPYSPALEKTLCDGRYGRANRRTNFTAFSEDVADFRNVGSFNEYYDRMELAGELMYSLLKPGKYLIVMIRDSYQRGEYIPTSLYVGERLKRQGFTLKGVKIWYQTGAPVRPYGYPYSYVPNIVHHNILFLKKEHRNNGAGQD